MGSVTVNQDKVNLLKRKQMIVTRFQAKAALAHEGLLDAVEQMMENPQTPIVVRLAWTDAVEFRRLSPTVATLSKELGLTDQQVDDLFELAKTIDA